MKYEKPELTSTSAIRAIQAPGTKPTHDFEDVDNLKVIPTSCYEDDE